MKSRNAKRKPVRFLWITDPWSTLDHAKDTTLRLIEECLRLGIEAWWCDASSIRWEKGKVLLDARKVRRVGPGRTAVEFDLHEARAMRPADFSHLFYRNDPPVDAKYIYPLQLLELGLRGSKGKVLNPPSVLFGSNEKTEFFDARGLVPDAVVSADENRLLKFLENRDLAVLKPLNSAQSKGVRVLKLSEEAASLRYIREASADGTVPVLLQEYLPGIQKGEVRLWFSGGKLVAKARKLPATGESVIDMDRGGQVVATTLTPKEKRATLVIGRILKKRGILWAAVDLIDAKITDFNFTSPGLLVQLEKITGKNLAETLLRDAQIT